MFAVVHIGGKQYKVHEKDELRVEKIELEEGKNLKIKEVFLISDEEGKDMKLGMPYVSGAHVECQVVEHGRGEKIRVFKMKPKKRYSKTQGHRQSYTLLKILKISSVAKKTAAKKEAAPAKKEVAKAE
ncbi:50S ribosomal protein L21 [Candidatus Peregrinibacteria bacterium]|jgi:large subunit ribosomal protein L21|nr:50S ribosomal protein L21 [Candidatus Peregrinibacteria bacterium]MBT4631880.1 50S ribosomal protein L21 [Candidatus Peregrinibacteria bacterium]MBT5516664.1 50S ribosomal protein L21 [Candidatus Peregrinibacteria bacterium]MBT5824199.1 50S ribosomal protein L21 [Candidatus Peregrinibacteria bacterium]